MAQDDEFIIGGRKKKHSGSQGSPRTGTSRGGGSVNAGLVRLGKMPGGSFTARMRKELSIAKRSSGRRSYHKPSKPRTGRFNARGRGRAALAAGIAVLSLHLLQNAMVYVNTHMLQAVLSESKWSSRMTPEDYRGITPLIYAHVNPYGRFSIDLNSRIDYGKIVA